MTYLIWFYIAYFTIVLLARPFNFGKEREADTPEDWLESVAVLAPLFYVLFKAL